MAFITSPTVIKIKNAVGSTVVQVARSLKFTGAIVVTQIAQGEAQIDGTAIPGVGAWDVAGNAGAGLVLGTSTADAWSMISNNVVVAGFTATGNFFVSSPESFARSILSIADPSAGLGTPAPVGSIAIGDKLWFKHGPLDTDWSFMWRSEGNTLRGLSPITPNQKFGSINNFDVPFIRNSVEIMRMINGGLIVGATITPLGVANVATIEAASTSNGQTLLRGSISIGGKGYGFARRVAQTTTVAAATSNILLPVADNFSFFVNLQIIVRQTSGGVGAVGDGASFVIRLTVSTTGGVTTILDQSPGYTYQVDPGITAVVTVSGMNLQVACTGVVGRNLTWVLSPELVAVQ